jgi:mycofactocin glycosyltransferase
VNVVVPFSGAAAELQELRARLGRLELGPGDSVVIVDNSPAEGMPAPDGVLRATEIASPGYARNRGAAAGHGDWIVFIDADTLPPPDLVERYFEPPPAERTGLLAGGVRDEETPPDGPAVARYQYLRRSMSQDHTLRLGRWGFAQAANVAVRRAAFEDVGGFREDIRAGEDADLGFRLAEAGWERERREAAAVVHLNRRTVRSFVRQKVEHGAGLGWLAREYPGSMPQHRRPGLLWWGIRFAAANLVSAARHRSRDEAVWAVFHPLDLVTRELGRARSNEALRSRP